MWRERREPLAGRPRLGLAHLLRGVEHLPLEVAQRDDIGIGQPEAPDTGRRKVECHGRAEPPEPHDEHRGLGQAPLPPLADLRQHRLPRVALCLHQSKTLSQSFHTTS